MVILGFYLLFISLSVSKGLSNFAEFFLIGLSLDRIFIPSVSYKELIRNNKHVLIFCLFYLFVIIGLVWTNDTHAGFKLVRHYHRWLIIPLLFLVNWEYIKEKIPSFLLVGVIIASLAASITIIFQWFDIETVKKLSETIPLIQPLPESGNNAKFGLYSPFMDRLQFSNLLGLNLLILMYLLINRIYRIFFILLMIPIVYCMVILGGRAGQISLFVGILFYCGLYTIRYIVPILSGRMGKWLAWSTIAVLFIAIMIGIPSLILKISNSASTRYDQLRWELQTFRDGTYIKYDYVHFTSVRRIISYQHMSALALEHPIIGVGTGDIIPELTRKYEADTYQFPVNIHSQFLYILCSWGIIGLLIFVFAWWYWLKHLKRIQGIFFFGLTFTVFYLTGMLSDPVLNKQVDLLAFIVMITTFGLYAKHKHQQSLQLASDMESKIS